MGDVIQFRKPEKRRQNYLNVYYLSSMTMEHFLKGDRGVFTVTPDGIATFSTIRHSPEIDRWPDAGINWTLLGAITFGLAIWAAAIAFAWSEFR
jgi:hypothetical protein